MTPKFKAITTSGQWVIGKLIDENMIRVYSNRESHDGRLKKRIHTDYEVIPETVCVGVEYGGKWYYHGDQYLITPGYFSTLQFKDGCLFSVYKHPEDGEEIPVFEMDFENAEYVGNIHDHLLINETETCECCGKKFPVSKMRMDEEDANWWCEECLNEMKQ